MMHRVLMTCVIAVALTDCRAQSPQSAQWRRQMREALDVPKTMPALGLQVWSRFSPTAGVIAERVTYNTADGMVVPAVVYRPDRAKVMWRGKLPGLVIVNGHGSDKFGWYAFYSGMEFVKAGAVVVTYDPIGEGERNARRASRESPSPHDVYPPTPQGWDETQWKLAWGRRVAGLMQTDLYNAVTLLAQDKDVDPKRIGVAGYSMGSFVAGLEGAWDTRVHAVLLSGGGVFDGPGEYYDAGKLPCQMPPYRALSVLGDRGAVLYALHAERGPVFVMNGEEDTVVDIPHHRQDWFDAVRARAAALKGSDAGMFTTVFYPGVSHRTSWVNRDGVEWLNRQLHFGFWDTDAKIEAQGVTHVSTWVTAQHVEIAKNYFREDREGGLDAVGTGFPGIPRAQLMVLSDAQWQLMQPQLVWESWRDKVAAELSGGVR